MQESETDPKLTHCDRRLKTGDPHRARFQRCHFRRQTRLVLKQRDC
jgi:hypothetical protein